MNTKTKLSVCLLLISLSLTPDYMLAEKVVQKHHDAPLHNLVNSICQVVVETEKKPHLMTGFFFKEDSENYYILTAAHGFSGNIRAVVINLFYNGHAMLRLPCTVVAVSLRHGTMQDYAILKISKKALDRYPPPYILPVKGDIEPPQPNTFAFVWGCARGEWPVGMKVHIQKSFRRDRIDIHPDMVGGMSGAPVINDKGELIGMVLWQNGYCVSVKKLAEFIKNTLK